MQTTLHRAHTRGHANHGWLNSFHTFSFANYHNPQRMHFGALRVLNDDTVAPAMGFGTHPHHNMEIVSIPLSGDLEHKDSMGNTSVIQEGDIQVMSAGTGIYHSEFNHNSDKEVRFLQIWITPNQRDVTPRYDQLSIRETATPNSLYQILSPYKDQPGVWIHQDAWFFMGDFENGRNAIYEFKKLNNGVYIFVIEGQIEVNQHLLNTRDGMGIWDTTTLELKSVGNSTVLLMEVPLDDLLGQ